MINTAERIERQVELKFDSLDRRLMQGIIEQPMYDELAKCIAAWAEAEYSKLPRSPYQFHRDRGGYV